MNDPRQRHYAVAVNAEALALAWARQEMAPAGSVVVVDAEISPRGRLGRLWPHPPERTAVLAIVWRPALDADRSDLVWLAASLALLDAAERLGAHKKLALWWPDGLVDGDDRRIGEIRASVQLGPGRVTSAVVTARLDLEALPGDDRAAALEALMAALEREGRSLDIRSADVPAKFARACALTGQRIRAHLLPRGAARGAARGVDAEGRLELVSPTGLVERVAVDSLDRIEVVPP